MDKFEKEKIRDDAEQTLGRLFAAARDEDWDAAPGFEERLKARLRARARKVQLDLTKLIWRAMPAVAAITGLAVVASFLTGSTGHIENFIVSRIWDPVFFEDLLTMGLI